jgi:hypothetical protein
MSLEQARQSLVTAVEAVKLTYPSSVIIEYDNRNIVDTHRQHEAWLEVKVQFVDAYQGDLGPNPFHRHIGVLELSAYTKEGHGTAKGLGLVDYFSSRLHGRQFGAVRTLFTDMRPSSQHKGWYISRVGIPFWFDVVVTIP